MSTSKPFPFKTALLLCLAVAVGSIPVAELGFRLMGDRPGADLSGLYIPFGDGSYKLGPSVDTDAFWSAGRFSVHTDELGLRCDGARQCATRPHEKLNTLFVGDSQGFGHGVDYEDTIPGAF